MVKVSTLKNEKKISSIQSKVKVENNIDEYTLYCISEYYSIVYYNNMHILYNYMLYI